MIAADTLLREVLARPDDDGPRLLLADFLAGSGDAAVVTRAEFIQTQIELSHLGARDPRHVETENDDPTTLPNISDDPRAREREARAKSLWEAHGREWIGPPFSKVRLADFHRGFLTRVTGSAAAFLTNAPKMFASQPVQAAHWTDFSARWQALAESEWLSRLRGVSLEGNTMDASSLRRFLDRWSKNPSASRLVALNLAGNPIGDPGAKAVATATRLAELAHLDLSRTGISSRGIQAIAESAIMPRLASLVLRDSSNGVEGLSRLVDPGRHSRLQSLVITGGHEPFGDALAQVLVKASLFKSLVRLTIARCGLSEFGMHELAAAGTWERLTALDLSDNPLQSSGVVALSLGSLFPRLSVLNLADNSITAAGIHELARSTILQGLVALSLRGNPIGDAGVKALAELPSLARLRVLDLCHTAMGDAGAKAIAGSPHLTSLRELRIAGNRVFGPTLARLRQRFEATVIG
jgi:uncharacterized protein (TIGR02996 family)